MSDLGKTIRFANVGSRRPLTWNHTSSRTRATLPSTFVACLIEQILDFLTLVLISASAIYLIQLSGFVAFTPLSNAIAEHPYLLVGIVSLTYSFCLHSAGIYSLSGGLLRIRETACLLQAVLAPTILLLLISSALHQGYQPLLLGALGSIIFLLLLLQKELFRKVLRVFHRNSDVRRRVLIYGLPDFTAKLQETIARSPRNGLQTAAVVDSSDSAHAESDLSITLSALQSNNIDSIFVAHPQLTESMSTALRDLARSVGIQIYFLADVPGNGEAEIDFLELDGQVLYASHETRLGGTHAVSSRILDIVASSVLLALLSIPLLIAAILVRLSSPGPILFRQTRIGEGGREFTIFKFRTMHTAACQDLASPQSSLDPRITRIGRVLRKTSVDELPQLLNVLRGEMALVGPRPEMPFIVADYKDIHRRRLSVKPGLTGLWQISQHRSQPIHENIRYDLYYLRYRSFFVDIAILLHTLVFAVRGI